MFFENGDADCGKFVELEGIVNYGKENEIYEISLHAIDIALSSRTMRMNGQTHSCSVTILMSTRCIHNFMEPIVAKRAGL